MTRAINFKKMKEIKLSQHYRKIKKHEDKVALVDDEYFEYLNQFTWHAKEFKNTFYAGRYVCYREGGQKKKKYIAMHREIMGISDKSIHVDHRDFNGLNNQKYNLRICNKSQNGAHIKIRKTDFHTSKYHGVCNKTRKRPNNPMTWKTYIAKECWVAQINFNGKKINLGTYRTEIEAARAYDEAAKKYHGEFATLNFPSYTNHSNQSK